MGEKDFDYIYVPERLVERSISAYKMRPWIAEPLFVPLDMIAPWYSP
jgi:hypothetical protein